MVRIIPWKLPDVEGGSIGGYTPAPTPEPLTSYPYDLDGISVSVDFDGLHYADSYNQKFTYIRGIVSVSGVVILDTSDVSSVIATVHVAPGTDTWADTGGGGTQKINEEKDIPVEIGSIMTSYGGTAPVSDHTANGKGFIKSFYAFNSNKSVYPSLTATTSTIEVTSITVYNSNGVALQEWEPSEE